MTKEKALKIIEEYETLRRNITRALGLKWNTYLLTEKDGDIILEIGRWQSLEDDEEVPEYIIEEYCN